MNYKVGFVTYEAIPELTESEREFSDFVKDYGIVIEPVIWSKNHYNYSSYNALVIRTPWDYFKRYAEFLGWLNKLEEQNVMVLNSIKILRENTHKFYLRDLQQKGINIIETEFVKKGSNVNLEEVLLLNNWKKAVIKPAVSGAAYRTYIVTRQEITNGQKQLDDLLNDSDTLIQKFLEEIKTEGEWSVMFFNKKYSHSVLKVPRENDFRVQEDHGGASYLREPSKSVIKQAQHIVDSIDDELLYARVDGVVSGGEFRLMELEITEPDMFLINKDIMKKFADAIMVQLQK